MLGPYSVRHRHLLGHLIDRFRDQLCQVVGQHGKWIGFVVIGIDGSIEVEIIKGVQFRPVPPVPVAFNRLKHVLVIFSVLWRRAA